MTEAALNYLVEKQSLTTDPALLSKFEKIVGFYQNRLWHQCSQSLLELIYDLPSPDSSDQSIAQILNSKEIYHKVIQDNLELRMSQLMHAEIAYAVVSKLTSLTEAQQFMERVKDVVNRRSPSNDLYSRSLVTLIMAKLKLVAKEFDKVEELLDEVKEFIESSQPTAQVHGRYYDVASSLCQVRGNHTEFYKNALSYLACGTGNLLPEEVVEKSFHACLALLLSEELFDLGEIIQNETVVTCLQSTSSSWVLDLIHAIAQGNTCAVEALENCWMQQPDLKLQAEWINTKAALLSLVLMALNSLNHQRRLTAREAGSTGGGIVQLGLDDIQAHIGIDAERICMKALALGLLEGSIDQVHSLFTVTWIKPLSLTSDSQLISLKKQLDGWYKVSKKLGKMLIDSAKLTA